MFCIWIQKHCCDVKTVWRDVCICAHLCVSCEWSILDGSLIGTLYKLTLGWADWKEILADGVLSALVLCSWASLFRVTYERERVFAVCQSSTLWSQQGGTTEDPLTFWNFHGHIWSYYNPKLGTCMCIRSCYEGWAKTHLHMEFFGHALS